MQLLENRQRLSTDNFSISKFCKHLAKLRGPNFELGKHLRFIPRTTNSLNNFALLQNFEKYFFPEITRTKFLTLSTFVKQKTLLPEKHQHFQTLKRNLRQLNKPNTGISLKRNCFILELNIIVRTS